MKTGLRRVNIRRQLTDNEREELLRRHDMKCFIDNHPVSPDEVRFHHVIPLSEGGSNDLENFAPICRNHHRRLGTLSLSEFRDKLSMERFFIQNIEAYLDDVVILKKGEENYGKNINYEMENNRIKIYFQDKGWLTFPLYKCPATGFQYFYSMIPIKNIRNDQELQPRFLIPGKLWALYSHFRRYTQLSPSICRLKNGQIYLFDGQHKAAAQIWLGRMEIECKVYIDPKETAVKEANIAAHTSLRQMSLYTSITVRRLSDLYSDYWEEWIKLSGAKSEDGFVLFLKNKGKRKREANEMIKAAIYDAILQDPDNKMTSYVAKETRSKDKPLTMHTLQRSLFTELLFLKPLSENLETTDVYRENERKNMITLLNVLSEETLEGRWNPRANDSQHKKTERFYRTGCVRTWSKMLKDVIAATLNVFDSYRRDRIFFESVQDENFGIIRLRIRRMFSHKIWEDPRPEVDGQLKVNDVSIIKSVFDKEGLTVGWVLELGT